MKAIGGFPELEKTDLKGSEYHKTAIRLNTGRNSLKYLIEALEIRKIHIPAYNCIAIEAAVREMQIEYQFYRISTNLEPIFDVEPQKDDFLLYVNYFGICGSIADNLARNYENLVIDNSQAFFEKPRSGTAAFNSARKFFGVPDGSYLYCPTGLKRELEQDDSTERVHHLYKRASEDPESAYSLFRENERKLETVPLRQMSALTAGMLDKIDYTAAKTKRNDNFLVYHEVLKEENELPVNTENLNGPLAYPFKTEKASLREYLISRRIFIPVYWKEVSELTDYKSFEASLVKYVHPLPCDQRYDRRDCELVIEEIKNYLEKK